MIRIIPRNTTMGSSVVALPAASDFSSHCPAEMKEKYMHITVTYSHTTKFLNYYLKQLENKRKLALINHS
jgi:hypothetical protein